MSGKWSDYQFNRKSEDNRALSEPVSCTGITNSYFEEERYAVVLEGVIM